MKELIFFLPDDWSILVVVAIAFLLMLGVISAGKARHLVISLVILIVLSPFIESFVSKLALWVQVLILIVAVIWSFGILVRMLAGKEAQGTLAAHFFEEILVWPFRAFFGAARWLFRKFIGKRSG